MSLQSYTDKYNLNEDIQNNILDFLIGTYDDWKNNYNIVLNGIGQIENDNLIINHNKTFNKYKKRIKIFKLHLGTVFKYKFIYSLNISIYKNRILFVIHFIKNYSSSYIHNTISDLLQLSKLNCSIAGPVSGPLTDTELYQKCFCELQESIYYN